jgi:hypothetical protein
LSAIRDLCGQFIAAYKTARRQDYPLVKNTIAEAMQSEKPENPPLLHSDGGGQYRSYDHNEVLKIARSPVGSHRVLELLIYDYRTDVWKSQTIFGNLHKFVGLHKVFPRFLFLINPMRPLTFHKD